MLFSKFYITCSPKHGPLLGRHKVLDRHARKFARNLLDDGLFLVLVDDYDMS